MAQENRGRKTRTPGVYKQKDGKWLVQVVLRSEGKFKQRQMTLPAETPEHEVIAARSRLRMACEQAKTAEPVRPEIQSPPVITFTDYCKRWIIRKSGDWRPQTLHDNLVVLSERILPFLGEKNVAHLQRADILEWRQWAQEQRMASGQLYSPLTLLFWWKLLRVLLNDLIIDHELSALLTFRVKPPTSTKPRVRANEALTLPQLQLLLREVATHFPAWYPEVFTLAYSGMRPSELYALIWSDIDLDNGTLTISKSVVNGIVGKTKNGRPRNVALTSAMADVLRTHRGSVMPEPNSCVFWAKPGTLRHKHTLNKFLLRMARRVGIKFRVGPQVLRYTQNTLLRQAGVADETVRDRLGHMTRDMGYVYFKGHISAQKDAVEKLQEAVENSVAQ